MTAQPHTVEERDLAAITLAVHPLWEQMRGQRVFVTGGTGFFGAWLLESFSHANRTLGLAAKATVLSRNPEAFRRKCPGVAADPSVELLAGDVRSFTFPDGEFAYVIHAATEASAKQSAEAPLEMLSTILAGTERALEFAATHGTRRFLLTSSGAVYGRQPANVEQLPEEYTGAPDPLQASSVYAEGKRASELMCALFAQGHSFECAIARCWAFCGPHLALDIHFAIGNFIRDAMGGGPIRIGGDGTPTRSYLYAADLATWLWTMLFEAPSLRPFNVGSQHSVSIRQLAEAVRDVVAPSAAIEMAREPVAGAPVSRYVPSVERAARELGLHQTVDLHETVRRTAAWYGWSERDGVRPV